jgi:hypothetical protein
MNVTTDITIPPDLPRAGSPKDDARNMVLRDLVWPLIDEKSQNNIDKRLWRGGFDIDNDGKWYVAYHDTPERYKNGVAHVASVMSRLTFYVPLPEDGCTLSGETCNFLRNATELKIVAQDGSTVDVAVQLHDKTTEEGLPVGSLVPPAGVKLSHAACRFTFYGEDVEYEDKGQKGIEVVIYVRRGDFGRANGQAGDSSHRD